MAQSSLSNSWKHPSHFHHFFPAEFMKTLLLMEATLAAENEVSIFMVNVPLILGNIPRIDHDIINMIILQELLNKKDRLQAAIRRETELIDLYKVRFFLKNAVSNAWFIMQKQLQEKQARLADTCDESVSC